MIYDVEFRWLRLQGRGPDEDFLQMRKLIREPDSEGYQAMRWSNWKTVPIVRKPKK